MALPVLDGNQTATTLSSVVTGGEHIVAHSVVCLGSTAIANITNAVSGSVVSISNFPSTQTIAGTVTAISEDLGFKADSIAGSDTGTFSLISFIKRFLSSFATLQGKIPNQSPGGRIPVDGSGVVQPISSGVLNDVLGYDGTNYFFKIAGRQSSLGSTFPVNIGGTVTVGNSVSIGSVPNGSLTTHFGTPTTANTAFATSAVTNANRKYLLIQNVTTGSNVITLGIGFTPTTTQGIQLTAGAGITFESSYIPTGAVRILSSVTASNFTILEA